MYGNGTKTMTHRTLHPFSYLDGLIIISCVAGALAFWPLVQSHRPATVVVFRDDTKIAEYPLSTPRVVTLRGRHGDITLSVRDNGVCVVSADCPRQVCVRAGTIRQNGQQIVCAPNHILIELQASSGNTVDAVTK
jgi:hypothetical protein